MSLTAFFKRSLVIFALAISVFYGGTAAVAGEASTYAERLGWPSGTKVVVFHVDDAGRSHSANVGTIKALDDGLATSTSIMMPRSGAEEFVAYVKAHPSMDAGLHLDLTRGADIDLIEKEILAQIDKALSMGITPTHLDSEGAMQFDMQYTDRFVKIAVEKKIPLLFYGGHMQYIASQAGSNQSLFLSVSKKMWDSGLPVIDDILAQRSHADAYEERKTELIKLLREMKPGITEVIFHCSVKTGDSNPEASTETSGPMGNTELEGEMDVRLLTDTEIKAFIKSEGIVLTTWRELMNRRIQAEN